jgi:hypothetical protein
MTGLAGSRKNLKRMKQAFDNPPNVNGDVLGLIQYLSDNDNAITRPDDSNNITIKK